ncbi:MAG: hypothetical protein FJ291_28610 [Planctomycetes bacterium]|nr:hypothetical protein [Planctomycetota bacterium]
MSTHRAERPSPKARSAQDAPAKAQQAPSVATVGGCLVRVCWMVLGNGALFFMAVHLAMSAPALSLVDAAFWGTVALIIGLRYLDVRKLGGLTVTNEPATMAHWRRYAIALLVVSLLAWAIARLVGGASAPRVGQ